MLSRISKSIGMLLFVVLFSSLSLAQQATGLITVTGNVTVNGQSAISGATLVSGSRIETAAGSTAILSLGKSGKVELAPETSLTIRFTDSSMVGIVDSGKVTVLSNAGIAATFATKDATIIADAGQQNNFIIEVECSHTHVDTVFGLVTMRVGTTDKQVAAGAGEIAGDMQQPNCKPCLRPGTPVPVPVAGIGVGAIAAILLGIGGAVITTILVGTRGEEPTSTGSTTVVSPTR
ncbi:MAG: hypothetical protein N2Z23_01805 [Pyrinomonadaceae bacterium]|nr:hypothetical protein [Pyrinomonadaceae bacterium]MCX7639166.1 hypothetical protein [Pyrinomonadaceae bacterium]MDW8303613.1 hypothetical protein [Acidobacteriota bacterium]